MPKFMVYSFCDDCSVPHAMGVTLHLPDGPDERATVAEAYRDRWVPPEVAALMDNQAQCPKTGRSYKQPDLERIYLSRLPG